MSSLKSQSPLKQPKIHSPSFPHLPSLGYHISGKEIEAHGSSSPWFLPAICAQLAGLPRFPAPPSAVLLGSPVLNPKPHGTFSWPTSKSPVTLFFPCKVSPVFFQTAKRELRIAATSCFPASQAAWQRDPQSHVGAPFSCQSCVVLPLSTKLSCRLCTQGELPPSYLLGGSHSYLPGSKHCHSYLTYP